MKHGLFVRGTRPLNRVWMALAVGAAAWLSACGGGGSTAAQEGSGATAFSAPQVSGARDLVVGEVEFANGVAAMSASGIYGDAGARVLTENDPRGKGFLAELAGKWESEAAKVDASVRLVLVRTSMVMSRKDGALGRLEPGHGTAGNGGRRIGARVHPVRERHVLELCIGSELLAPRK